MKETFENKALLREMKRKNRKRKQVERRKNDKKKYQDRSKKNYRY